MQLAPIYPQVEGCFAVDGAAVIDQGAEHPRGFLFLIVVPLLKSALTLHIIFAALILWPISRLYVIFWLCS